MALGLERNNSKSEFYVNGIKEKTIAEFINQTGFALGELPFRYLGVPVSSKRLSVLDCEALTDKIVARIRGWGAKKLSYMGRLTLVKAVLNTLHIYWAQIFILPMAVIKKVDTICRTYLWERQMHQSRGCPVAWEEVCYDKEAGGLGIIFNKHWNQAAIGKLAWWIHTKADHVWVRWVHHVYIRGSEWLDYKPSLNTSWCWRKICSVKEKIKGGLMCDRWLKQGQPYTVKKAYQWLQGDHGKQGWTQVVWSRYNIPRHTMIAWLAAKGRIATLDRMVRFGISNYKLCFLCQDEDEDGKHLFFDCVISKLWMKQVQQFFGLREDTLADWKMIYQARKGSRFQRQIYYAFIVGTIYYIWQCRNESRVYSRLARSEIMFRCLRDEIRSRAYSIASNLNHRDSTWFANLYNK